MLDIEDTIKKLTVEEKCSLVAADDWWHTISVPRLGIPAIRFSDGPNGVRGQYHFNSTKTTCFPAETGLAATWNKELIHQVGELLSEECKLKGARLLLGPTVNIARGPLGGRAFESFSEDPVLSGLLASQYIKGVQAHGIACSLKHFVCNDQEFERNSADSVVSDRALREIYLLPFQLALRDSKPLTIMTSYNKVNGIHCSESQILLREILREEWGFEGLVISDWLGTYSTAEAIKAGLDLEAPGPSLYRKGQLMAALRSKKVLIHEVEDRCRKVLKLINDTEASGIKPNAPELEKDFRKDALFLRNLVAEGVVLLKNTKGQLPIPQDKKTAVIGFNAAYTAYAGGGSSLCHPYYHISPLKAIKEAVGAENVTYEPGAYSFKFLPTLGDSLKLPDGTTGVSFKIFKQRPDFKGVRECVDDLVMDDISYFRMNDYYNDKLLDRSQFWADIESTFIPESTGEYLFGIAVHGVAKLFIDGELVVDNMTKQTRGSAFYGMGAAEIRSPFYCEKGRRYKFHIVFGSAANSKLVYSGPEIGGGGGLICGGILNISAEDAFSRAVALARKSEQVIVVTGLNKEWESEGADRVDLSLPPNNDEMISQVLDANPDAVVVVQSGSPVDMTRWVDKCHNLLYISYAGNETGHGLADVIFGKVSPSGKLPLSFPRKVEDNPTFLNFGADRGKVYYGEGVYVGYRYYEKLNREVLFPFGYGLSYSTFSIDKLAVNIEEDSSVVVVSVRITNSGKIRASEVVQVYVGQMNPTIKRPLKELKEFTKIDIEAGASHSVELKIPLKYATSFWDEEVDSWISEADEYEVFVGTSSLAKDCKTVKFTTEKTFYWKGL